MLEKSTYVKVPKPAGGDRILTVSRFAKFILSLILSAGFSQSARAGFFSKQSSYGQNGPGTIPLKHERPNASDLVYQQKTLLPDEAEALFRSHVINDLSELDPESLSNVWHNEILHDRFDDSKVLNLNTLDFQYVDDIETPLGQYSFIVAPGFQVIADPMYHDMLLRQALLRRIGYSTIPMKHMPQIRVHFTSEFQKQNFIRSMKSATLLPSERWILDDKMPLQITIQDVVLIAGYNDQQFNPARGIVPFQKIQGRRIFSSLLIPFSLVDCPEDVNTFSPEAAKNYNGQLKLFYTSSNDESNEDLISFNNSTSYEDARWIMRRISKLNENDWQNIVEESHFPFPVNLIVLEKIKSRRNDLIHRLNLGREFADLPVDLNKTELPQLDQGVIAPQTWAGATEFSHNNPAEPLTKSNILGFFKSFGVSNLISNAVANLNTLYGPHSNNQNLMMDHELDVMAKTLADFIKTGKAGKIPFHVFHFPTYDGSAILGREIVAGQFMGSDNSVQIADTIGASLDYGAYFGADGLAKYVGASASANVSIMRTYTHIKPITQFDAAWTEPFANMIVPWIKRKSAAPIDDILNAQKISDLEAQQKQVDTAFAKFDSLFNKGESYIIQTSFGPRLSLNASYSTAKAAQIVAGWNGQANLLWRIQILRRSDAIVDIYEDNSQFLVENFSYGFNARIPIITFGWNPNDGLIQTTFYQININKKIKDNPYLFNNALILKKILLTTNLDDLHKTTKWNFSHNYGDHNFTFDFLWWNYINGHVFDNIVVTNPTGEKATFIRKIFGSRSGVNYQNFVLESLNAAISKAMSKSAKTRDYSLAVEATSNGNPGDTFEGQSRARSLTFESRILSDQSLDLSTIYLNLEYRWKGWEMTAKNTLKIFHNLARKFGTVLFHDSVIGRESLAKKSPESKIELYNLDLNFSLYQNAIVALLNLQEKQLEDVVNRESDLAKGHDETAVNEKSREALFHYLRAKLYEAKKTFLNKDHEKFSAALADFFDTIEERVSFNGILELVGGVDNVYIYGTLDGFRTNIANGNQTVQSETIGQVGSAAVHGPLEQTVRESGASESEALALWQMTRY